MRRRGAIILWCFLAAGAVSNCSTLGGGTAAPGEGDRTVGPPTVGTTPLASATAPRVTSPSTAPASPQTSAPASPQTSAPVSPDKLLTYPPLPTPLSSENLAQYINAALFAKTGRTCMSISDEFVPEPSIEEMAQEAEGKTGLLPGGTTFVGGFDGASAAFGGESSGIELDGHAYTIGRANGSRWAPKLPPDTWIMYEFKRYDLPDGREVWRYQYSWWASPEDCGDGR